MLEFGVFDFRRFGDIRRVNVYALYQLNYAEGCLCFCVFD